MPPDMAEDIMARLVRGHHLHLVQRRPVERDVRYGDARGGTDPRDIGGEDVRLARAVEHVDMVVRNAAAVRDLLERDAHRARRHRLVVVEQGPDRSEEHTYELQ